jgi:hypothetical protein
MLGQCRMSNFPRKPNRSSGPVKLGEVIVPPRVEFLGEQTDAADEQKKTTLRWIFEQTTPRVFQRAYLARVSYGEPGVSSVLLCFRNIDSIERKLEKGFKHMFGEINRRGDFYDCMMIDEEQERQLRRVCKPFYEMPQPAS